jgi:NTE family protein
MDVIPPAAAPDPQRWRPPGCERIALVLQGGGALGAYQAGVYQALEEAGVAPDWVSGVSIGGVNAALIAGNPPERRVERLRAFWERVTARPVWPTLPPDGGDALRRLFNAQSALAALLLGQPGFFAPTLPNPWLSPRGARTATAFYDTAALRETLAELVDFGLINRPGEIRFAVGAVNVATGNFAWFDNAEMAIGPEHVMASGALPPALPMVRVGTDSFWDGGLVSNTPLQHLLDQAEQLNTLVFQVDLFPARGPLPRDMREVLGREKDIRYSSRTRYNTDMYMRLHAWKLRLKRALAKLPEERLTEEERRLREELADLPEIAILQLIYQQQAYETHARGYEFSAESMREHWRAGLEDTRATLCHRRWLAMPPEDAGIVTHDVHRERG